MDDIQIIELYLQRDESAISHTAQQYGPRLRGLSYGIVADMETAKECENDTYLQAWNSIPPNEPRSYLYAYLARIIRHISIDCCRRRSRIRRSAYVTELSAELEACIPSPCDTESRIEGILLGQVISTFLRKLPQQQRNVFLRRYWYMDSIADISKRYFMTQSKVKSILFRCRNALRDYLIKEGYTL